MTTFSIDTFVGECIAANTDAGRAGVKGIVDRVISMPAAIEAARDALEMEDSRS